MQSTKRITLAFCTCCATVQDKDMNIVYICKNDEDPELRKAIYIGEEGQVTTLSGRSLSGCPERSQEVPSEA